MKVVSYSTKQYDRIHFDQINKQGNFNFDIEYFDFPLTPQTAKNAAGADAVCIFVNDDASRAVLKELTKLEVKILALRCAGFNNVDLAAAKKTGYSSRARTRLFSPEAVAEHTVGLMLCLNRRIHRAYQRTRDANFSLEGLTGFNMHNRTAGMYEITSL